MVYLTRKQRSERLRMYIGSIHESIEDGHIVPNMYTVNFVVANDIEPQFVNTNLSDFGVPRG